MSAAPTGPGPGQADRAGGPRVLPAAEHLQAVLRQRIVSGAYAGGARLTEEELAGDLSASRTSVREALRVLQAEGFVVQRPYFGTFVATMTPRQAFELLEVQAALESLAAGLAAARRSGDDVAQLRRLVSRGRAAARAGDADAVAAQHGLFHQALARAGGNETLATLMAHTRHKIDWVYAAQVRRTLTDSWDEHETIVDAVEDQDPELAAEAARRHVRHGSQAVVPDGRDTPATT